MADCNWKRSGDLKDRSESEIEPVSISFEVLHIFNPTVLINEIRFRGDLLGLVIWRQL